MSIVTDDPAVDLALIDRMAVRDAGAVAELYDRHSRLLFGLILRILRNRGDAEEVLQESFVLAWSKVETYDRGLGAPVAWLVRIARNRAIDRLRSNEVRTRTIEQAPVADALDSPETSAFLTERQRAVARALDVLPAEQRELIETAYFKGLTQAELADHFKLPLGTVKTRIRSGMAVLRRELQHVNAVSDRQYGTP